MFGHVVFMAENIRGYEAVQLVSFYGDKMSGRGLRVGDVVEIFRGC
jgi:hypothetical protein